MLPKRWLDRCTRWTTLWTLVLATFAPGIAHALHHLRGEWVPWSVVCSASGIKRIVLDAASDSGAPLQHAHAFEHCASCALHHDGAAPAPADTPTGLRADLGSAQPTLFLRAPRPLFAWRAAQPRAPPSQA